jgi:hypothetical protein
VGAQENRKRGTDASLPGFDPLVELTDTTSVASSPPVAVRVTVLSGMTPHVLLLQPGLGPEKQSPQPPALANEQSAEPQRAGRYVDDT